VAKKPSYYEQLKDPRWQRARLEAMKRADFTCEMCYVNDATLNVHHTYYEKGLAPWEYPSESLWCLCEDCHKRAEALRLMLLRQLGRLDFGQLCSLIGMARGLEMSEFPDTTHSATDETGEFNRLILSGIVAGFRKSKAQSQIVEVIGENRKVCGWDLHEMYQELDPSAVRCESELEWAS
jgi:hypothetical protein